MEGTYGFIEVWLAEFLHLEFLEYYLDSGVRVAAVDRRRFDSAHDKILDLWRDSEDSEVYTPLVCNSMILGMKVLLHKYWINDDILDELTGEDVKVIGEYEAIKKLGPSGARFDLETIKNIMQAGAREVPTDEISTDEPEANFVEEAVEAEETIETEKTPENLKNEETQKKTAQQAEDEFFKYIKRELRGIDYDLPCKQNPNYRIMIAANGRLLITDDIVKNFENVAVSLKKNIIVIKSSSNVTYVTQRLKKTHNLSNIEIHTLFFILNPEECGFTHQRYGNSLCLGFDVDDVYSVKLKNKDLEIEKIRSDSSLNSVNKDRLVAELLKQQKNSPFYKYDAVYKDTITNVIWAVKDRCILYLLVPWEKRFEEFYELAFTELIQRYNYAIPYLKLKEIDQKRLNKRHGSNKDEYIKFSITNSKVIIDELKRKRDEHRKQYKEFLDKAMEHAKMFQKFNDQISYFDEEKFVENERKKAMENYNETLAINKVSAITIKNNAVHVYTHNIYVQDERTKHWHDIGTFHIEIGMLNNTYNPEKTLTIHNTKYQTNAYADNMQAPHVWADGHICHGNLASGMTEAYKRRNLFELVYQVILFLESANTSDSAGQFVDQWPEVSEEVALNADHIEETFYETLFKMTKVEKKFDEKVSDLIPLHI